MLLRFASFTTSRDFPSKINQANQEYFMMQSLLQNEFVAGSRLVVMFASTLNQAINNNKVIMCQSVF